MPIEPALIISMIKIMAKLLYSCFSKTQLNIKCIAWMIWEIQCYCLGTQNFNIICLIIFSPSLQANQEINDPTDVYTRMCVTELLFISL